MARKGAMMILLDMFFKAPGTRPWIVLICLLIASSLEGIGIASLLPLLSLLTGQVDAVPTGLERHVVDGLALLGVENEVGPLLGVIAAAIITKGLVTLLAMRYVGNAAAEMASQYRRQLTDNILNARWNYLISQPMGQISNTISVDVYRAAECYVLIANMMTLLIQTAIFATVALFVSWQLALGAAGLGLFMTVALHWLVRIARRAGFSQTTQTAELVTILSDSLNNLKPIRAMGRERGFTLLLDRRIQKLRRALRKAVLTKEAMNLLQEIIVTVILIAGLYLGLMVWDIALAEITVAGLLLGRIISSVGKVQKTYQKAVTLESAYVVVNELLEQTGRETQSREGGVPAKLEQAIELEHVQFAHAKLPVLHDVSMRIEVGQLTVLLGPSGAGKTTIVDTILRLHEPSKGRVLVDGQPLAELDLASWRSLIGYVPQELLLLHDTIHANITLGDPTITDADIAEALRLSGCDAFIAALPDGLMSDVGEKGAKLSGGQRQRIALARALAKHPKLLILDEVTSALDPETGTAVAKDLAAAAKGIAVVSITHRPEMLAVADRVYKVQGGRVSEIDSDVAILE